MLRHGLLGTGGVLRAAAAAGRRDRGTQRMVRGEDPVVARLMLARRRHERREARQEVQRLEDHVRRTVAVHALQFQPNVAALRQRQPLLGNRGPAHVADQPWSKSASSSRSRTDGNRAMTSRLNCTLPYTSTRTPLRSASGVSIALGRITPQLSRRATTCPARSKRIMKWRACCAHVSTYNGRLQLLVMRQSASAKRNPSSIWRIVSAGSPRTRCVSSSRSSVMTCETFTTDVLANPDSDLPTRTLPGASASARLDVITATMTVAIRL